MSFDPRRLKQTVPVLLVDEAGEPAGNQVTLADGATVDLADGATVTVDAGDSVGAVISDQVLTVSTTSVALTVPGTAKFARIEARCALFVEAFEEPALNVLLSEKVRYRLTGAAPSATVGFDLENLDSVFLGEEYLADFRALRGADNAADGTLYVTYFAAA